MTSCDKLFGCSSDVGKCANNTSYLNCLVSTNSLTLHTICAIQAIFALGQKGYPITETNILNCAQLLTPSLVIDPVVLHQALVKGMKTGLFRTIPCGAGDLFEVCPGAPSLNPALTKYTEFIRMFSSCRSQYPNFEI